MRNCRAVWRQIGAALLRLTAAPHLSWSTRCDFPSGDKDQVDRGSTWSARAHDQAGRTAAQALPGEEERWIARPVHPVGEVARACPTTISRPPGRQTAAEPPQTADFGMPGAVRPVSTNFLSWFGRRDPRMRLRCGWGG
jgi:hypothetical protein